MAAPTTHRRSGGGPDQLEQLRFLHRGRPPRDDGADVGRAARDGRRRDPRRAPRRCHLALPARSRRSLPDARRDERPRSLPDRPGPGAVRRGRHRPRRRRAASRSSSPTSAPTRASCGSAASTSAGSSPRCCQRAAVLARPDRRRPQRPDRAPRDVQRRRRRPARRRSPTCSPGSSRRAASRPRPRSGSRQLRQIDEARSELIALVTHELRTPLAVVRAYTELLADDPPLEGRESRDPDRRAQRAGLARRGARAGRAARPPRRLDPRLGPDRPRRGRPTVTPTDVEALVAEVVDSIRPILRQHHLEVRPGVRLHALADPPRLRQILEHLIENAVKYAPPETTITIDRPSSRASSGSASPTRDRASPTSGASGSSSRTPGATRTPRAAPGSGCTPPSGSANRWAPACGASRPSRPAPASSSPCRPRSAV